MRLNFSTSWIFRGWIPCVLVVYYAQTALCKAQQCDEKHYLKFNRCCKKCEPGFYVYSDCTDSDQTICRRCNSGEYQPGWTEEKRCLQQRFCDKGKGFMERPENPVAEEPCRCRPGHQCFPINCEFCERIPTCGAGYGLETDPDSTTGRQICVACKKGFFSAGSNTEQCKQYTNCKAEGRSETKPGSAQSDAECGPPEIVPTPSWVIVSVLSVITILSLVILVLFCYKDKLNLLSVNLRSCVQNLKRTRIQQETLAPLYHSGAGGGGPGGPKCTPCEMTKLICQAPHSPADDPACTFPTPAPEVKISLPFTEEATEKEGMNGKTAVEDRSEGSGEPEEVSEEEEVEEVASVPPLVAGSCVCLIPIREPLEVGENEDCSQAVSPGTPGTCSCGGLDGDRDGAERSREQTSENRREGAEKDGGNKESASTASETGVSSLVSLSPPPLQTSSVSPPSSPAPELCLPLSQAQLRPEFRSHPSDSSSVKQEGYHRLPSTDASSAGGGSASALTSVSPLMTSSSAGELYLDKPSEAAGPDSWRHGRESKLPSGESELECSPESLHSQLAAEPTLTSGVWESQHHLHLQRSGDELQRGRHRGLRQPDVSRQ
ncbi:tumor necrosis factor receptor superfamily member 11A isoform X2 [Salarias fasciatus]|uniref:tumor necrosis factor receptor superfamily member 11A isoform X2 n=1 Tax=Salarias fasciatus TaxID=181472 RepID=UPI001176ED1C|nr:tumor necrosis factor receptor superfamily member 11A-like isoform X2 [Salarias fasciatus]